MNQTNKSWNKGVAEEIGHYVYRLIDPRNGLTFYVGEGKWFAKPSCVAKPTNLCRKTIHY